ncbi:hypothetical protein Sango_0259400 [Sesamum angolense]|uniref:Reverse transcriptase domain-containing protein n=1 Tax=Sesamum angolense TaxID=2727404 RepID=A0AAE1XHI1_9LAMI|nr:hypothetical protein Sango_0259400 [Sesamum angolense]
MPKDFYPLPLIDQLVDSTPGCELLSMMDASQGYHQIILALEDRKRVRLISSAGTFCYVAMPFGLKYAGATYQHLVDKIFCPQIKKSIVVYVDDMLVKSKDAKNHVTDLEETFNVLRSYRLKLNLGKCTFGAQGGCYLGFMVTQIGIEANPLKIKAILDMKAPTNVDEVQRGEDEHAIGKTGYIRTTREMSVELSETIYGGHLQVGKIATTCGWTFHDSGQWCRHSHHFAMWRRFRVYYQV